MARITQSELARKLGVTPAAIRRAVREGRIELGADGLVDAAAGEAMWLANRRRRPRTAPPAGAPEQAPAAGDYWASRAVREQAEAGMATLREAEMRGDLVRRDRIILEFSTKLIALREALETLAARLAPLMVAETDLVRAQRILRDEHRAALTAFVDGLDPPQEEAK